MTKQEIAEKYKKDWKKLFENINKVVGEGYKVNIKIPETKVKDPTEGSLRRLNELNRKVLEESTKFDKSRGEEVDRKHMQNRENLARGRIRGYDYTLKKGKKIKKGKKGKEDKKDKRIRTLTPEEQYDYISIVFDFGNLDTVSKENVEIQAFIKRIEGTYLRLESQYEGSKDGSLEVYVQDWRARTYRWLSENKNNIAGLKSTIRKVNWKKLDITEYDSDGVGINDFIMGFEDELVDTMGRTTDMAPPPEEYEDEAYRALQTTGKVFGDDTNEMV